MCNMPACNTFRSFTICLIIAIIITESPTSGFTIRRIDNTDGHEPDLTAEESSLLEVKHDLKRLNDIKSDSQTKIDGKYDQLALENKRNESIASEEVFLNSSLISKESDIENKTQHKSITESNNTTIVQKAIKNERGSNILQKSAGHISNSPNISNMFVSSDTSTPSYTISSSIDVSESSKDQDKIRLSSASPFTEMVEDVIVPIQTEPKEIQITTTNTPKLIITGVLNFQSQYVTKSGNSSKNPKKESEKDLRKFITEIENNKSKHDSSELTTSTAFMSTNPAEDSMAKPSVTVDMTMEINNDITSSKYNDDTFSSEATRTPLKISASLFKTTQKTSMFKNNETSKPSDVTEQFPETMIVEETSSIIVEPLMKKYTEIDRKLTASTSSDENTSPTTTNDNEMVNADNMRTRVSLDKVFSASPILSLEKLKQDLMSIPTQTSTVSQSVGEVTQQTEVDQLSTFSTVSFTRTPKREMVSSMRAGFLDLTAKTVEPRVSTAAENKDVHYVEHEKALGTVKNIETDGFGNKTVDGFESQSQLAEDAIKEELLKEEMLQDNEENAKRYHDEAYNTEGIRLLDESFKKPTISQSSPLDDSLSVKPISQDKSKLYTVSPNYKPMKKIDVQPYKQFVRDPDDNSWRNESISSLGIVFKPKNSSKSFTQVLKNKTETEFTNLSDRNKNDPPELRERLEKIAEVRKSKKRINKFGETIYTDYEENSSSGEILTTPKPELGPELFSLFTEAALLSTSIKPTSTSSISVEPVVTSTATTSTTEETVTSKQEGLDVNATKKPKKLYNIAEYYDSNDEYDADYVHLSKIDLKKFPAPFKAKEPTATPVPVEFPQTKSTYSPDRKATLQYFPPRLPPKVKHDDYDDNFLKKVNVYPYKHRGISFGTTTTLPTLPNKIEQADTEYNVKPLHYNKPVVITKNLYLPISTHTSDPRDGYGIVNNGNYNRPTYVIKHFNQDFLSDTKDHVEEKTPDFLFTDPPIRGVTINDLDKSVNKIKLPPDDDYDYDSQFRKDIMNRFVDNFNQNSEKYKVDFPILYNNSVIHRKISENGKSLASSSAFMKRLYSDVTPEKVNNYFVATKPCDPHCDNITVELSPAYELHYYVPDQEEKEEVEQRPTISYRYRL